MTATRIEWAEHTWNHVAGCSRVNAACDHCYAVRMAYRQECIAKAAGAGSATGDYPKSANYIGLTTLNPRGDRHFNGEIQPIPEALADPLKRRKPTRYFVNSMSDVFHDGVPFEFIDQVCGIMCMHRRGKKRAGRLLDGHEHNELPRALSW